jgi:hypothetical protein
VGRKECHETRSVANPGRLDVLRELPGLQSTQARQRADHAVRLTHLICGASIRTELALAGKPGNNQRRQDAEDELTNERRHEIADPLAIAVLVKLPVDGSSLSHVRHGGTFRREFHDLRRQRLTLTFSAGSSRELLIQRSSARAPGRHSYSQRQHVERSMDCAMNEASSRRPPGMARREALLI